MKLPEIETQREKIVNALRDKFEGEGYFVTRKILDYNELSGAQLPAIAITNGVETNSPAGMGDELEGLWDLHLGLYIKSFDLTPQDA